MILAGSRRGEAGPGADCRRLFRSGYPPLGSNVVFVSNELAFQLGEPRLEGLPGGALLFFGGSPR